MRVLWVDADGNPWTDSNGWKVLKDFGLEVRRVGSVAEAQNEFPKHFDLVLVRAELPKVPEFLVEVRRTLKNSKIVLASSEWSKEQFREHSKTPGAAHRYARIPMPPEGFLNLLADLFGCSAEDLAEIGEEEEAPAAPAPRPKRAKKSPPASGDDIDVLRKYLAIREDELGLADNERDELARENERLQKEAHHLQLRLRELEHMHEELEKKLGHMEIEKREAEKKYLAEKEEAERNAKLHAERVKAMESQVAEAGERYESLRSRVRKDIRKIRENERDLEARLELTRKDSATLLSARDEKVLHLQRKIDALEFDLDQIQDSRVQAQIEAERYLAKLSRVSRALQIANHLIEDDHASDSELEELEPLAGGAANAEELPEAPAAAAEPAAGAETPPADEPEHMLSPELEALAHEGEATQMISAENLHEEGGEPESSNG